MNIQLQRRTSVKDLIESLGVPHTEVEYIIANGASVGFDYIVNGQEFLEVVPAGVVAPVPQARPVRPPVTGEKRFVLDTHLGKLSVYLRLLGFDTLYRNDYGDDTLAAVAVSERRILLSRDRGLLKRGIVEYGYYPRETAPDLQAREVLRRYDIAGEIEPFRRCIRCNGLTSPVSKADVLDRLEPKTRKYYDEFRQCESCGRIYWKGSHYGRMRELIEQLSSGG